MNVTHECSTIDTIPIPFDGDTLEAIRSGLDVHVSIRRVCEALGLNHSSQLTKLKGKEWAVVAMIAMTGPDGKQYESACIHIDALPLWLATISTNKVSEDLRPKLVRYQLHCARALRDHFFGPRRGQQRELWPDFQTPAGPGQVPKGLRDYECFMRHMLENGAIIQPEYALNVRGAALDAGAFVPTVAALPPVVDVARAVEDDIEQARRVG